MLNPSQHFGGDGINLAKNRPEMMVCFWMIFQIGHHLWGVSARAVYQSSPGSLRSANANGNIIHHRDIYTSTLSFWHHLQWEVQI